MNMILDQLPCGVMIVKQNEDFENTALKYSSEILKNKTNLDFIYSNSQLSIIFDHKVKNSIDVLLNTEVRSLNACEK